MKKKLITLVLVCIAAFNVAAHEKLNKYLLNDNKNIFSLGINAGTSFASPVAIANLAITVPIISHIFAELGSDHGFFKGRADNIEIHDVDYMSWFYYGRVNLFAPYRDYSKRHTNKGGWYIGPGFGIMKSQYTYNDPLTLVEEVVINNWALVVGTGFFIGEKNHLFRIDYSIRTNFFALNHRAMLGYTYRFGYF